MTEKEEALHKWMIFLATPDISLADRSFSLFTGMAGVAAGACTVEGGGIEDLQPAPPQRRENSFDVGTRVSFLKVRTGGNGATHWFPYIERGVGECEIPKNCPVGTVALTGAMNGCSLRIYENATHVRFCHDNNGDYLDHAALTTAGYRHLLSVNAGAKTRGLPAENTNNYWDPEFDRHLNTSIFFISVKSGQNEWKIYKSVAMADRKMHLVPGGLISKSYTIIKDKYLGGQRFNGLVATLVIPVPAPAHPVAVPVVVPVVAPVA